jgi:hypothetical protein
MTNSNTAPLPRLGAIWINAAQPARAYSGKHRALVRWQPSFWPSLLWHSSSGSPSAGKPQDAEWLKQLGSVTSSDTLDGTLAQPDGVALASLRKGDDPFCD